MSDVLAVPSTPHAVPTLSTLVTTYLEMRTRAAFRPEYRRGDDFSIQRMLRADVPFYRFLYAAVGAQWHWRDRALLDDAALADVLSSPQVSIDVLYVDGVPGGYIELARQGTDTEISYFGLRPQFIGAGYGKHLLSHGVARAWSEGARRVWLHTCNLDGPHAMENYLKRGFSAYRTEHEPMPARYQTA